MKLLKLSLASELNCNQVFLFLIINPITLLKSKGLMGDILDGNTALNRGMRGGGNLWSGKMRTEVLNEENNNLH